MENEVATTRTQSVINRASVKTYSLGLSHRRKAGKFTRVSEAFLTAVEADVEAFIRKITPTEGIHGKHDDAPSLTFTTKAAREKMEERLEEATKAIIFNRVMRHPSIGCTLMD